MEDIEPIKLLPYMFEKGVINFDEKEEILKSEPNTREGRAIRLMDMVRIGLDITIAT